MEITQEIIEAVRAHEAAAKKAQEKEWADERFRKYREWEERVERTLGEKVRLVFPDISDTQLDFLKDTFSTYYNEMDHRVVTVHEGWRYDPEIPRFGSDDPPEYEEEHDWDDWPEEEY